MLWRSMSGEQLGQAVQHVIGVEPAGHHNREATTGERVDHAQHAEGASILGAVMDEVI